MACKVVRNSDNQVVTVYKNHNGFKTIKKKRKYNKNEN